MDCPPFPLVTALPSKVASPRRETRDIWIQPIQSPAAHVQRTFDQNICLHLHVSCYFQDLSRLSYVVPTESDMQLGITTGAAGKEPAAFLHFQHREFRGSYSHGVC
jgi:hypothetical protein